MNKKGIVKAILEYDRQIHGNKNQLIDLAGERFAKDSKINRFLFSNPNAFLFGVIFDQGIPAERAWSAPYLLRERLGHLDLEKMVRLGPEKLSTAIMRKPALHRYRYLGEWIFAAAQKLIGEYDGDASGVWQKNLSAATVLRRLKEFRGIGQKKANMAVRILNLTFGIPFKEMGSVDIPYDIHIRRVFLRLGFVDQDSPRAVISAARELYPPNPSKLDVVWHIGRNFCHSRNPECSICRLTGVCPKLTDRGQNLRA